MREQVFRVVAAAGALAALVPGGRAEAHDLLGPATRLAGGLYEVRLRTGPPLTTHGPDSLSAAPESGEVARRPLQCTPDFHQHVLYARHATATDRHTASRPVIEAVMENMNAELDRAAMESGNRHADYRVRCDVTGALAIGHVVNLRSASFADVVDAARLGGAVQPDVNYTIFYDDPTPSACGVGSFARDDSPGPENESNRGTGYAVIYRDCWNGPTAMHENAHNMGAVQPPAPNAMGDEGHCRDEADVMCYPDGTEGDAGMRSVCPGGERFDCGYDDYFDAAPEPGEYLATHWNLGSPVNRFIWFMDPLPGEVAAAGRCASGEGEDLLAIDTVGCPVEPEPDAAPEPDPADEAAVRIVRVTHHRRKQRVQVRLACPSSRTGDCRGRVLLARQPTRGVGGRAFRLEPGMGASVRIPLTGSARRDWGRGRLRRVWVIARATDATADAARKVSLR